MRFWPLTPPQRPAQADEGYERHDAYSKLLDRNGRWVEVADTKAAVILAFLVATFPSLMGPALPAAQRLAREIPRRADLWAHLPAAAFIALLVAFGVAALTTLVHVLLVLTPRLVRQWKPGLVYFGDIAAQAYEQWQQQMLSLGPEGLAREVLEQVYATAYIADRKHKYVRQAIRSLLITVLLGLVFYVLSQVAP